MLKFVLIIFFIFPVSIVWACPIIFQITDKKGKNLSDIIIFISETYKFVSDKNGIARFDSLPQGNYKIRLYKDNTFFLEQEITFDCKNSDHFYFILDKESTMKSFELKTVAITSKSKKKQLEETPFSVQVIEMKNEYDKSGDVSNLLNQSLGVKLRTNGSLGSSVQINLGGLQGKAIKVFRDGIPIELFGHGFSLGTIPSNMLERVEIYKGVMPIYLASDALGGGINLVTRNPKKKITEISYEVASFNTHRATANLFFIVVSTVLSIIRTMIIQSIHLFTILLLLNRSIEKQIFFIMLLVRFTEKYILVFGIKIGLTTYV